MVPGEQVYMQGVYIYVLKMENKHKKDSKYEDKEYKEVWGKMNKDYEEWLLRKERTQRHENKEAFRATNKKMRNV